MPYSNSYSQGLSPQSSAQRSRIAEALMRVQNPPPVTPMPQVPQMQMPMLGGGAPGVKPQASPMPGVTVPTIPGTQAPSAPGMPGANAAGSLPGSLPPAGAASPASPMPPSQQNPY